MKSIYRVLAIILVVLMLANPAIAVETKTEMGTESTEILFDKVDYTNTGEIRVYLDNVFLEFSVKPQIKNGSTLVPFRKIFEELGMTIGWDPINRVVTGENDTYTINLRIGSNEAVVNGEKKTLITPPMISSGSTLVPLRFISETLGYNVVWVSEAKAILISQKNIVEWRYGGIGAEKPYEIYEVKYVNGKEQAETRLTGKFGKPSFISLYNPKMTVAKNGYSVINVEYNSATNPALSYVSADTSIATVDSKGTVRGVTPGNTTIIVKNADGATTKCEVEVAWFVETVSNSFNEAEVYEKLVRSPKETKGEKVEFSAEVLQSIEEGSKIFLRVAVSGDYKKVVMVYYDSSVVKERLIEGDYATFYGIAEELYTYTSVINTSITIPLVRIEKIVR